MRPNLLSLSARRARTAPGSKNARGDASWSAAAKFLHWLVAALIFLQFALGWLAAGWRLSPTQLELFAWHKSIGMLVLALVLLRLPWRLAHPAPALPADTPAWERGAARASHALLYLAMIGMPLSGWIISAASGVPFRIFWRIPLPAIVAPDKHLAELAALAHFSLWIVFVALLVLHVGAALRHHFLKRDDVLVRMLPSKGTPK